MESSPADKKTKRRATRPRATRQRAKRGESRVVKKPAAPTKEIKEKKSARKAPTPIATNKASAKNKQKRLLITAVFLLAGVGASAAVGSVDKGWINVSETIEARNERIRTNTSDERDVLRSRVTVPVQNTSQKADGGLVGRGTGGKKPTPPPILEPNASSTATSTDSAASSTVAVASSTAEVASSTIAQPEEEVTVENEEVI